MTAITRESYRKKRIADFLKYVGDFRKLEGLEIGPLDFPTFRKEEGKIKYADFLSYEELLSKYHDSSLFDTKEIVQPDYIIRALEDYSRIQDKFDYIIACHVMEHVPNPFGFICQLLDLLHREGVLFLAIPDKRFIAEDVKREETSLAHLLLDFVQNPDRVTFDHYFDYVLGLEYDRTLDVQTLIEKSKGLFDTGTFEIHSHVWTDQSFLKQIQYITEQGWIPCKILSSGSTPKGYNEFTVILKKR
jgi:SAM-dependent methyltransferase